MTFDEIYEKVKKAAALEVKYRYIDFDGKKTYFSKFMISTLKDVLKRINKTEKQEISNLINLFEGYHTDGVYHRRTTIEKTLETFARLKKLISSNNKQIPQKQTNKAEKKEFQQEIDDIDVAYVKGVGPQLAKIFNKMGIFKVRDLIEYYPKKYVDYIGCTKIKDLKLGQNVTIYGTIAKVIHRITKNNLAIFNIYIKDSTGVIGVTFFIKTSNRKLIEHYKSLYPTGSYVMALGVVKFDDYTQKTILDKAQIQILGNGFEDSGFKDRGQNLIMPIYMLSEGLSHKTLTGAVNNALEKFKDKIYDCIPCYIIKKLNLEDKKTAIYNIHKPDSKDEMLKARYRLVFEELFSMQLNLALIRKENSKDKPIKLKPKKNGLVEKFIKSLPYELTNAQKRVIDEIFSDLNAKTPMQRLLQGDVGSGKTVVACIMLLCAIENGFQGAIMAPTEILAAQHYRNFSSWLTPLGLSVGLFTGKNSAKVKKEMLTNLKNGQIHVAVGTHALIQEKIEFNNLGAIVIDEQHRFGVKQRNALLNKGQEVYQNTPQMLNMTATPIPRTLALTLHGDLDVSIIDELPKGRKPIITTLGGVSERNKVYDLIKKEIFFKHQAYIVYPLIDESEIITAKAATIEAQKLQEGVFKDYRVGLLHGKMDNKEKDDVMNDFKNGKFDVLVSTTVVEVGVDNPNATVILIENAERFGLSQLHQLRGRVGRSELQSYCALITSSSNSDVRKRLDIMTKTNDGFIVSQKDLELRGPGEFLGTRQSGLPDFKLADITQDSEILELARQYAFEFVEKENIEDYPLLKNEIENHKLFKG